MLKPELLELIKDAMRAKDKIRLNILRQVHEEVKNIEVNERREITEADVDNAIKKLLKMTNETLEGSIKAGNDQDRTDKLTAQVSVLESILPSQLDGAELESAIDELIAANGYGTKRDMGKIMGALNAATGGNFDKPAASKYAGSKLS